ncbi:TetR/AcrR family transcriptional regulator [Actinokineospora sp.]|uniref:TetR/AcrR family transcriptional regulator n=1 Tax=Actinokineospora sp. TaxID=1872133 RepID=UPI003D6B175C
MSSPRRARRAEPKPDPAAALLRAAARLFAERGYDDVSIDEIANEAGVAKGLLYYYFTNKRALYVAIIRDASDQLAARTAPDPSLPAAERTAAVLTELIDWAKEYRPLMGILLAQGTGAEPEIQRVVQAGRERQIDMMLAGMRDAAAELDLPIDLPAPLLRHTIRGWIAFLESTLTAWLPHPDISEEQLKQLFLHAAGGLLHAAHRVPTS